MSQPAAPRRRQSFAGILAAAVAVTLLAGYLQKPSQATDVFPAAPVLYRIDLDDLDTLEALGDLDVWEYHPDQGYALVAGDESTRRDLARRGLGVAMDTAATDDARAVDIASLFSDGYRTVDELYTDLSALAESRPVLAQVVDFGDSYCKTVGGCTTPGGDQTAGYDLLALRITNEQVPGSSVIDGSSVTRGRKPILFFHAAIHAREITTPELAMRLATQLLAGHNIDADLTWLVDQHEIWIVPVANPDGHWIVELGALKYGGSPFYHRKNADRDANADGTMDCNIWPSYSWAHFGVDLNRNHSFAWGPPGSSNAPCDTTYRGPAAASEPETQAIQSLVQALFADARGPNLTDPAADDTPGLFITAHSYGDLVLYPWGFPGIGTAPNHAGLKAISDRLAVFSGAESCQSNDPSCLYGANGATDDWVYGELGIPAFTFEIGQDFMPPFAEIDEDQWPRYGPSFVYAAKLAAAPYRLAFGPDVNDPLAQASRSDITLSAIVNDTLTGGRAIQTAEFTIDQLPGTNETPRFSMQAADGAFDEPIESVRATIETAGLAPGRHTVFIHGRDADGNWGPITAVFITVERGELPYTSFMPSILMLPTERVD